MVQRCAWGTCNADERYPERLEGGKFIRFPTPKRDIEKCKRWIKACGRPHCQLNIDRINQHKAVCSKHFIGGNGPTQMYPDPVQADGSNTTPARRPLVKRSCSADHNSGFHPKKLHLTESTNSEDNVTEDGENESGVSTQTENSWVCPLDMLAMTVEVAQLKEKVAAQDDTISRLQKENVSKNSEIKQLKSRLSKKQCFSVQLVTSKESKLKNVFKYYTGITYIRFLALLNFLVPPGYNVPYETGRRDLKTFQPENGLFLTVCRLRHGFGIKDLAVRFGLSLQSTGVVFNTWIELMYLKLCQLSIWPLRDTIIKGMPAEYKHDFPTSLIIIDGTEVKTQSPCALGLQSQMYSDYKSSTTLKGLIGCDPNGCLMFVSELFTGSISDKALTQQSGFYNVIKTLKAHSWIKEGDAVMADKGFVIEKEISELGLKLNTPPFASANSQMSVSDTWLTNKIAKHRVHIERLICKVKTYKILSHCIPTSLFQNINKIWTVCCYLTLFQDIFVKDKGKSSS